MRLDAYKPHWQLDLISRAAGGGFGVFFQGEQQLVSIVFVAPHMLLRIAAGFIVQLSLLGEFQYVYVS